MISCVLIYGSSGLMFSRWKANAMSYTQISVVKNKWGLPYWIILSANYNFTCNKEIRWTGKSKKVSVGGPNQTQDTWLVQPVFCHWAMRTGQFSTFQHETRSKQCTVIDEPFLTRINFNRHWASCHNCYSLARVQVWLGQNYTLSPKPDPPTPARIALILKAICAGLGLACKINLYK